MERQSTRAANGNDALAMNSTCKPARNSRCPNCHKRASLKEHYVLFDTFERAEVATWQCIYCGAICEPRGSSNHMICTRIDQITLAPGELERLRDERNKR